QTRQFLPGRHAAGTRAARFGADIDKIRSLVHQLSRVRYRGRRVEGAPAVRKRIGRDVDHARDQRAIEREPESATAETSSSHGRRHEKARSRLRASFLE